MKKYLLAAVVAFALGYLVANYARIFPVVGMATFSEQNSSIATSSDFVPRPTDAIRMAAVNQTTNKEQQRIIRTASITLQVDDIAAAVTTLTKIATDIHGFLLSSSVEQNEGQPKGKVIIKVPADQLSYTLEKMHKFAHRVISEQITAKDVTVEYIDLQTRLKVAEAGEQQYLEILKQTKKVSEVLDVMQRLNTIRAEIESLKGRLKFYQEQTDLARITVNLHQIYQATPITQWQIKDQVQHIKQKLIASLQWLSHMLIWLVMYVLPIALLLLPIIYLFNYLIRWLKRWLA